MISAANAAAVEEEWNYNGLTEYVDICMTQEYGSKAECIEYVMKAGSYEPERVMMIGDAWGDYQSAEENNVLFYPIQAGKEAKCWRTFREKVLKLFVRRQYNEEIRQDYFNAFKSNLE